jgi:hypothetical protein
MTAMQHIHPDLYHAVSPNGMLFLLMQQQIIGRKPPCFGFSSCLRIPDWRESVHTVIHQMHTGCDFPFLPILNLSTEIHDPLQFQFQTRWSIPNIASSDNVSHYNLFLFHLIKPKTVMNNSNKAEW